MADNTAISSRELFHATLAGVKFARPPFWMMRQAGRYLPEYRQLKDKHGFLGIVKNPEAAVEAALQPIRRFDFDCAILFSDILVISEALGFPYRFKDGGGIAIDKKVSGEADIREIKNNVGAIRERLSYVAENAKLLRAELPKKAVLGFCGSPFTIAAYMVEGGSGTDFSAFKNFFKTEPKLFEELMEALSEAVSEYAMMQIECGVDGIQIFDSHAALAPEGSYREHSGVWIGKILSAIEGRSRSIVFAPSMSARFGEIAPMGADAYSLDASAPLSVILNMWKSPYALQGNLDAALLSDAPPGRVEEQTKKIVEDMLPYGRHIFNLGHGIRPDAKIENVEAMCRAVKSFK